MNVYIQDSFFFFQNLDSWYKEINASIKRHLKATYKTVIFNFHCYVEDILTTLYVVIFRCEFEFFVPFSMNSLI